MTPSAPVSALLISDRAEDVKHMTVSLREQLPGCRVEAVYTADQALEWASQHSWHLVILDLEIPDTSGLALAQRLRQRAPQSHLILHSDHRDISPIQAMRSGAAALLYRQPSGFLADLLSVVETLIRSAIGESSAETERTRYLRLIESPSAILYELNKDGQFTYVSEAIRSWLGYDAKELLGAHYTTLLHSESRRLAEQRFNERRAGARATRRLELRLLPKARIGKIPDLLQAQISAKGMYASPEMFLGTVGMIQQEPSPKGKEAYARGAAAATAPLSSVTGAISTERPSHPPATIETIWQAVQHFLGKLDIVTASDTPPGLASEVQGERSMASLQPTAPQPQSDLSKAAAASSLVPGQDLSTESFENHPGQGWTERRGAPRQTVQLQSEVTIAGEVWRGITTNLSTSGLCVRLSSLPQAIATQQVGVSLVSDVLFLQLTGLAGIEQRPTGTLLRVRFGDMEEVKRIVLRSFLEILADHPDSLKVQIQLPYQDSPPEHYVPSSEIGLSLDSYQERRLDLRVPCHLPVQLVCRTSQGRATQFGGTLIDLHLRGGLIRTQQAVLSRLGTCELERPSRLGHRHAGSGQSPGNGTSPVRIQIHVVRDVPPGTNTVELAPLPWSYGVQFTVTTDEASTHLRELVGHAILSFMGTPSARAHRTVVTELLFTHNAHDARIAIYHDYANGEHPGLTPMIIIAPDIGRTKEEYLRLSYCLATQGFHVLRYDPTNHIGESDGNPGPPFLSQMQSDLGAVLAFADEFWPGTPVILLGDGLGGRLCARILQSDWWVAGLALFNLPLDISEDLHVLQHTAHDPLKSVDFGRRMGHLRGVQVLAEAFVQDAVTWRYVSDQDLLQDLTGITVPICIFAPVERADRHQSTLDQMRAVLATASPTIAFVGDDQSGHLAVRPGQDSWAYKLAHFCMTEARHGHIPPNLTSVSESDLVHERKLERQRLQCVHHWSQGAREGHWASFAKLGPLFVQSSSFRRLLEALAQPLEALEGHQRVLEVGCGNGELASLYLTNRVRRLLQPGSAAFHLPEYVGLDVSGEALGAARANLLRLQNSFSRSGSHVLFGGRALSPHFVRVALDGPIPLPSSHFDAVVANLLFVHTDNPLVALREYVRVLVSGGLLLLLAPKPNIDLDRWFEEESFKGLRPSEVLNSEEALRDVLCEFRRGWLEGALHRFDHQELVSVVSQAHAVLQSINSGLNDQIYIVVARKP